MDQTKPTTDSKRRMPLLRGYTKDFYQWCHDGELRFQRCRDCATWRHPPRPMCGSCHSLRWDWAPTAGKGKVHCWTVVYQALDAAFADDVPYVAAIVELDEGPRLATWVTGLPPDQLYVGMPVEVWFDPLDAQAALPKFRP
jgi:uncharacterized OB-fold protein